MNNPQQSQKLILPVQGMTCTNCTVHVETALKKLPGVSNVIVDLKSNQASMNYDPAIVDLLELQNAIEAAGYSVPTQSVTLMVSGMSCVSCVAHVEGALQDLPGVLRADVHLSQRKAVVQYISSLVSIPQMETAVQAAGYSAQAAASEGLPLPQGENKPAGSKVFAWMKKTFHKPGSITQ